MIEIRHLLIVICYYTIANATLIHSRLRPSIIDADALARKMNAADAIAKTTHAPKLIDVMCDSRELRKASTISTIFFKRTSLACE